MFYLSNLKFLLSLLSNATLLHFQKQKVGELIAKALELDVLQIHLLSTLHDNGTSLLHIMDDVWKAGVLHSNRVPLPQNEFYRDAQQSDCFPYLSTAR
jgi:hypothetical protein